MFRLKSLGRKIPGNTDLISGLVTAWMKRAHTKDAPHGAFVLDGNPLADGDAGSTTSLLPLLVWHADNLYKYGINKNGFGVVFHVDNDALLLRSVSLHKVYRSASELLCFVTEALEDARANLPKSQAVKGAVELRSLVNQFTQALGIEPESAPMQIVVPSSVKP